MPLRVYPMLQTGVQEDPCERLEPHDACTRAPCDEANCKPQIAEGKPPRSHSLEPSWHRMLQIQHIRVSMACLPRILRERISVRLDPKDLPQTHCSILLYQETVIDRTLTKWQTCRCCQHAQPATVVASPAKEASAATMHR